MAGQPRGLRARQVRRKQPWVGWDSGRGQCLQVAVPALTSRLDPQVVGEQRHSAMAVSEQVLGGPPGACPVIRQDRVPQQRLGLAVHEHDGTIASQLQQPRLVIADRTDQQPVHVASHQGTCSGLLNFGIIARTQCQDDGLVAPHFLLDCGVEFGVERVGHRGYDQPDRLRAAVTAAQAAGLQISLVAERVRSLSHRFGSLGCHPGFAIDHPGDRLEAHPGRGSHILHGRTRLGGHAPKYGPRLRADVRRAHSAAPRRASRTAGWDVSDATRAAGQTSAPARSIVVKGTTLVLLTSLKIRYRPIANGNPM